MKEKDAGDGEERNEEEKRNETHALEFEMREGRKGLKMEIQSDGWREKND